MKLQNFTEFEPFTSLREKMEAKKLGSFEIFDPKWHLTGQERSSLSRTGLVVPIEHVGYLLDFTLVYKNSRIWVLGEGSFHVANCGSLKVTGSELAIGTAINHLIEDLHICSNCLQILQFQGYDHKKARKERYSRQVLENFKLSQFWRHYHLYPVSEKRDIRKALHQKS